MDTLPPTLSRHRAWLHKHARMVAEPYADLLDPDDLEALVDLGMVQAFRAFDRRRGVAFPRYARRYVEGLVRDAAGREIAHRRLLRAASAEPPPPPRPHAGYARVLSHRLLAQLPEAQATLYLRHVAGGESLAEIARDAGHHRAWATRLFAAADDRLRRVVGRAGIS